MLRNFYTFLFALLFLLPGVLSAQDILYIASSNPAEGSDLDVIAILEEDGFTVIPIGASELTVTSHLDYEPDVIVFGEALSSSAVVPFADAGFPVPCVSMEGYCARSNRWALLASDDDFGQIRIDNTYGITPVIPDHYTNEVLADHPIMAASGLSVGDQFLWSSLEGMEDAVQPEVVWYTQMPQTDAVALAKITDATNEDLNTLWALEPNSDDATNPLQHRLVIWGVHENGFAGATDAFGEVLKNSILWTLDMLPTTGDGEDLLYIARNNPPDGNDPSVIAGLQDLGYNVIPIGASEYTVTSHLDYDPDVIFFGEYLSSSGVTPFADAGFPTPCVSLEGYAPRSNRWALLASDDDFGQIRIDNSYGITPVIPDHYTNEVVADHPIMSASGFSVGDQFLWSNVEGEEDIAQPEVVWYTQMPQTDAVALAEITDASNEDLFTLWAIEPNADDATNPLQHRLVLWGVHDNGLIDGTDDFWTVIDNSIQWVLGNLVSSTTETDILEAQLKSYPNPFSVSTQIEFSLKTSADVELRVFDAYGRVVATQQEAFADGAQQMTFMRNELPGGVYYYGLFADGLYAGGGKMIIQ